MFCGSVVHDSIGAWADMGRTESLKIRYRRRKKFMYIYAYVRTERERQRERQKLSFVCFGGKEREIEGCDERRTERRGDTKLAGVRIGTKR